MDSEESDDGDGLEGVFEDCAVEVSSGRDDADVGRKDVGRRVGLMEEAWECTGLVTVMEC